MAADVLMMRTPAGGLERRRYPRRVPAPGEPLSRVRLRTGRDMTTIDVSDNGALVEGAARILPGTHVDAHVVTRDGRLLVRSRIVRAFVCDLRSDRVTYRAALAFERKVDTGLDGYEVPQGTGRQAADLGTPYPPQHAAAATPVEESL